MNGVAGHEGFLAAGEGGDVGHKAGLASGEARLTVGKNGVTGHKAFLAAGEDGDVGHKGRDTLCVPVRGRGHKYCAV